LRIAQLYLEIRNACREMLVRVAQSGEFWRLVETEMLGCDLPAEFDSEPLPQA
jgi:hypothetical protein